MHNAFEQERNVRVTMTEDQWTACPREVAAWAVGVEKVEVLCECDGGTVSAWPDYGRKNCTDCDGTGWRNA